MVVENRLDFQLSPSCKTAPPVCFILRCSQTCIDHLKVALQLAGIVGYTEFHCYVLFKLHAFSATCHLHWKSVEKKVAKALYEYIMLS